MMKRDNLVFELSPFVYGALVFHQGDHLALFEGASLFLNELIALHNNTEIMFVLLFKDVWNIEECKSLYTAVNNLPIDIEIKYIMICF